MDVTGEIHLQTSEDAARFGTTLGVHLRAGDVVLMEGDLGAGKTAIARAAISEILLQPDDIPSPTFTIVQTYSGRVPVMHADLYRLSDESEIYELGLDEAFEDAVCFVEWPDRLGAATPQRHLRLTLRVQTDDGRRCEWRCSGDGWEHILPVLEVYEGQ